MILRPVIPSLPSIIAAVTLAIAIAAVLIAPGGAARPDTPGDPDGDGPTDALDVERGTLPYDADSDDGSLDSRDAHPLHPHRH